MPGSERPFRWPARTGSAQRRHTVSSLNDRVSEEDILRGHFGATRRRFAASDGPILILHDTTEFSWRRKRPEAVGFTTMVSSGKDKSGRDRMHTVCGLLIHSSLAATTDGLPLGMAAAKFWTRKKFKGTNALRRRINPTRVRIEGKESMRWLDNLRQSAGLLGDPARCVHNLRPRRRYLGVVLPGPGVGHPLPRQALFRQARRRRLPHGGIDHGRGEGPGAAPGRRP